MPDHSTAHTRNKSVIYDYNKADFSTMSMYLNGIDWALVYADCTSASALDCFLPARRYASAGYRDRNVSVRLCVRHAPVLWQNEEC